MELSLGVNSGSAATLDIKSQLLATVIEAIVKEDHLYRVLKEQKQHDIYDR